MRQRVNNYYYMVASQNGPNRKWPQSKMAPIENGPIPKRPQFSFKTAPSYLFYAIFRKNIILLLYTLPVFIFNKLHVLSQATSHL